MWLKAHRFPDIPIESLIIISNPSAIIETTGQTNDVKQKITHSINLPFQMDLFKKKHTRNVFSEKDLSMLTRLLMEKDTPLDYDVLKFYQIKKNELRKGVHCPECRSLPMLRLHGKWKCTRCGLISKDAHIETLKDDSLLIGREMTNQKLRHFLMLNDSRTIATNLLKSMNLPYSGEKKGRKYFLPEPE